MTPVHSIRLPQLLFSEWHDKNDQVTAADLLILIRDLFFGDF